MRASTLFALTAALLLGLLIAVGLKMSGWLNPTAAATTTRPAPLPQILVAATNVFSDTVIAPGQVKLRPMRADEKKSFDNNKDQYLPAVPAAAIQRIAKVNIEADTPITRDLLKEMKLPDAINARLVPDMRAINLSISKDRSAGGLIAPGDWVDVYLTSTIANTNGSPTTRTAVLAPKVRVIAKRNSLWPILAALPKDKPIEFTLEVNQYRGELIEFARTKGNISISPIPAGEQKELEANRMKKLSASKNSNGDQTPVVGMGAVESASEDEKDEIELAQDVAKGEYVVSDVDLMNVFGIKPTNTPPPAPALVKIERISGVARVDSAVFTLDGQRYTPGAGEGEDGAAWHSGGVRNPKTGANRNPNNPSNVRHNRLGRNNAGGVGIDASNVSFTAPDCPNCKKKKGY